MFRKSFTFLLVSILSLVLTAPGLAAPLASATTVPGGNVSGVWDTAGSPYLIDGDVTVPAGETLTIELGVEVLFQGWYSLTVNGTLIADGTAGEPILFTTTDTNPGWLGIRFMNASDTSSLTYTIVEKGHATGANPLDKGGGIYIDSSSPTISHSTIRNNLAKSSGGGLYLNNSNATLIDNTIINNTVAQADGASGGGIHMLNSNPELTGNVIRGNTLSPISIFTPSTGAGGGIFARSSYPVLRYNVISDNSISAGSSRGGGLHLYFSDAVLINNTITGNTAGDGDGIYLYYSEPTIVNTILWDSASNEEIYVSEYGSSTDPINIAYTDIQGGQAGIVTNGNGTLNWLAGNIDADPLFVDAVNGDYQLQADSPAVDAGTAYFELNGNVLVDLSSSEYNGSAPDMGAFEFGNGGSPNQPPVAVASVTPDHGSAPLTVQFASGDSYDPDGTISVTSWDFGDGSTSSEANPSHTYMAVGTFQVTLTVTDNDGATHSDTLSVEVQDGTTIYAGNVSGTWDAAGSPYRIEGDITVPAGGTLTIEPGAVVSFQNWYSLTVNGILIADGTASEPILFTTTDTSPGWLGIRFINASDSSSLAYAIVEKGHATGANPLDKGGGIYIDNSSPTISHSTIRNNLAKSSGGGLYLNNSNANLFANTIINNTAGQLGASASGGGLTILYSNPILTDNVISGNSVYVSGGYTTPSGHGGGLFLRSSNATLTGNLINDNHVNAHLNSNARGGGLFLYYGSPSFVNNTITGNTIENESTGYYAVKEGGGIYSYYSRPTFVNTILWNDAPEEIFVTDSASPNSTLTFAYSDLQGGQAGITNNDLATINWEAGNIDTDPLFGDAANGDYQLQDGSPAIDTGTTYFEWNGNILVDLSPGEYNGDAPDMGAFESEYVGGGSNQAPVAVATANPQNGEAPLTIQFNLDGSYDPDGTITTYAWDFGDGNASNEASPSHIYNNAGTYNATLTVIDDQGATGSAALTINVIQASQNELHVQAQNVTRERVNRRSWQGVDTILITDQNNQPVAGVTVTVNYSGPNQGQVSGVTNTSGIVTLYTDQQRKPQGTWCFEVVEVAKVGYTYNPNTNVVTLTCE